MKDLLLNIDKGYYDIGFTNGDFTLLSNATTAMQMSLFCEKRADVSEIPAPEMRRGWWGNLVLGYDNYETGSKLWQLEQARNDLTTLNLAKTYTADCLQWFIADNYAKEIRVDTSFIANGVLIEVELLISLNETLSAAFALWDGLVL